RQLQEIRDAKLKGEARAREARLAAGQQPNYTIDELRADFLALHFGALPPPQRGHALQGILLGAARLAQLEVTEPLRVLGDLIDGEDIVLALEGQLTFRQLIDRKVKAAQVRGLVYIHPLTNKPKVT